MTREIMSFMEAKVERLPVMGKDNTLGHDRMQGHAVCKAMRVAGGTPPRGGREVSRFPLRSRAMLFEGGGGTYNGKEGSFGRRHARGRRAVLTDYQGKNLFP